MKKVLLVATFALLFVSCNTAAETTTGTTSLQTDTTTPVYSSVVEVSGSEFIFSQKKILGHVDETMTINFINDGAYPHNFVIPDLNITTAVLKPGEKESVEITPETAGTYEIICSIAGHKEQGMFGEFIVK